MYALKLKQMQQRQVITLVSSLAAYVSVRGYNNDIQSTRRSYQNALFSSDCIVVLYSFFIILFIALSTLLQLHHSSSTDT